MNKSNIYEDIVVNKLIKKYGDKIEKNNDEYNKNSLIFSKQKLYECMLNQRLLLKEIIVEIIKFYPDINKCDFIMLNGSYARHTNILYSDVDLNILYNSNYKKELLPIELKINYILSRIFNYRGCDRIHSIMVYTPLKSNKKVSLNGCWLNYEKENIKYYCRENFQKLLFETINTSRDYNVLISYFRSSNNSICDEWKNNFELVEDFGKYEDFIKEIEKINLIVLKRKDFNELLLKEIDALLNLIEVEKIQISKKNEYIKKLKFDLKTKPMNILYKMLSILSKVYDINLIKLECFSSKKIITDEIETSIYKYLWAILRVEIILNDCNLDLSSHSSQILNMEEFGKKYYNVYKEEFYEITLDSINELYTNINNVLKLERSKIK